MATNEAVDVDERSPAAKLVAARRELEAATKDVRSSFRDLLRLEPLIDNAGGVALITANMGEGSDRVDIMNAEQAAWLAQNLIRIFGLTPSAYHGSWIVRE